MGFNCGIVGLPNVGKSTIFNALTEVGAQSENYPFCTIEPNVGRVAVPDIRMEQLDTIVKAQKIVPTFMEFVDIAGLVKGASKGEGLGNKFLGHIRSTDAIINVVRCFDSDDIIHVEDSVDPIRDIEIIQTELIFADVETVEKALARNKKLSKSGRKDVLKNITMLEALFDHLQAIKSARSFAGVEDLQKDVDLAKTWQELHLITAKPAIYVCNVDESLADGKGDNVYTLAVKEYAKAQNSAVLSLCGKLEEEISQMDKSEKTEMLEALGMQESGLSTMIHAGYKILGLETYFTAGVQEIHAWTILKNSKAPTAAGKIHSDFERGFICAEVYIIEDLLAAGSKVKLKELGKIRIEGRDYIVKDGEVLEFRFNV